MGNKISVDKAESEKIKDTKIYKDAIKLKEQYKIDFREKRMDFNEFNEKMGILEQFIQYYELKYNI